MIRPAPVVEADRCRSSIAFRPEVTCRPTVILSTPLVAYPDANRISQLLQVPLT
jgi:hypothetical protein